MSRRGLLSAFYAGLFFLAAIFPGLTLFSGQVIKQFESYSLAESMARLGFVPYHTTIPCDGGIRWVLELPIFVSVGAPFVRFFPEWPSILPILVFATFLWGLWRLKQSLDPKGNPLVWLAIAATPVFLRFSTQFLADPLAVALLIHGVAFHFEKKEKESWIFFLLAVSMKPTVLPSIVFFHWAFSDWVLKASLDTKEKAVRAAKSAAFTSLLAIPFVLWAFSLRLKQIPNPLHEGGLLAFGIDLGILLDPHFYSKFLVWTFFKGVGPILGGIIVYSLIRKKKWPPLLKRLAIWSFGIIPYWLLVRRLNFIHDYYSLSFYVPIALWAGIFAGECLVRLKKEAWIWKGLLVASALHGVILFVRSGIENPHRPVAARPIFCGKEFRSEKLMGLPRAEEK